MWALIFPYEILIQKEIHKNTEKQLFQTLKRREYQNSEMNIFDDWNLKKPVIEY